MKVQHRYRLAMVLALATLLAACAPAAAPAPIRIGSKDFTEQLLLGEMYAQILESNGLLVERHLNLGGTEQVHEALTTGKIDLYPEYTGTGYLFILGMKDNSKDPNQVYQRVTEEYRRRWNLTWLDPAPMNDTNAVACTLEAAAGFGLRTLSDLALKAPDVRMAGVPDFPARPDGLLGLQEVYGGFAFKSLQAYAPGTQYRAITEGTADCVVAFSTDGQVSAYHLTLLQDDKGLWPPYNVAPVVRAQVLDAHPEVRDLLNELAPLLTNDTISSLNWRVAGGKQTYQSVAQAFLREHGLVK